MRSIDCFPLLRFLNIVMPRRR